MSPLDGTHTLVLMGELNRVSAHTLEAEIERLCEAGTGAIKLDLSKLTHIDPTGVAVIAFRSRLCERRGHGFALIRGPWFIQREFELAGLSDRLQFEGEEPRVAARSPGMTQTPLEPAAEAELATARRARSRARREASSPHRAFSFLRVWQSQKDPARP
jgi:anti-anti-sigma factor